MRRFELSDGKSHKFWEIEATSTTINLKWGRIGAAGQTKSKSLASEDQVAKELEKLVSGKVKKGYVEILAPKKVATEPANLEVDLSGEEQPAQNQAGKGDDAPTKMAEEPLPDEDLFVMPSHWKTKVSPRRGGKYDPQISYSVKAQLAKVKDKAKWKDFEMPADEDPWRWSEAAWLRIGEGLFEGTFSDNEGIEALIRLALATKQLQLALKLLCQQESFGHPYGECAGLWAIRTALAQASPADVTSAKKYLDSVRLTNRITAVHCAYLMPHELQWFQDGLQQASGPSEKQLLYSCPSTVEEVEAIFEVNMYNNGVAETLAVEFGHHAVPLLTRWLDNYDDVELSRSLAKTLLEIPHDDAVEVLFERANQPVIKRLLPTLFERYPVRCIRLGAPRESMALHIQGLLSKYPQAVDVVMATASPELKEAIQALQSHLEPSLPEATLEDLHPLFANPPWLRQQKKATSVVFKLAQDLPLPHGVLSKSEEALANKTLKEAVTLHREGKLQDLVTNRWSEKEKLVALYLHGTQAQREVAEEQITTGYWYARNAQELALSLIKAAPLDAGRILRAAIKDSPDLVPAMVALASPETAKYFLESLEKKRYRSLAGEWLQRHSDYAIRSWLPLAFSAKKKPRWLAEKGLLLLADQGFGEAIRSCASHFGEEVVAGVDALLNTDPLETLPKKVPNKIEFLNLASLPRPKLANQDLVLPLPAVEVLVRVFAISTFEDVYAGVAVAKKELDAGSLADFAWNMFQQWLAVAGPSKHNWAMTALGLVGNDWIAEKLTPMIRAWPGESQHQRAVAGLDVLLGIGTDLALMHLNGIAQKVKFKGIKKQALERIERLAKSLKLTKEELADRLVPTLDLDADGRMILDYGPRKFIVGFDEALKPFVLDEHGKRRKSLPKPAQKDDAEMAEPAEQRFKALKKHVRALAGIQISRFQQAMIVGRRWSFKDFRTYLVNHPLLIHLVRRLVWGVYEGGRLAHSFRVSEDNTLADVEDEDVVWPEETVVGILHPIDISTTLAAQWGELLGDYQILQPFPQLGRALYHLNDAEKTSTTLTRYKGTSIPVGRVLGLQTRGWERGEPQDAGIVWWFSLPLPDGIHELQINLEGAGLWIGMGAEQEEDPVLGEVWVVQCDGSDWGKGGCLPFGELSPALTSELIATLEYLVGNS